MIVMFSVMYNVSVQPFIFFHRFKIEEVCDDIHVGAVHTDGYNTPSTHCLAREDITCDAD